MPSRDDDDREFSMKLIKDLETENAKLSAEVAQLTESLELARTYQGIEAQGCPLCIYQDGVFVDHCSLHRQIQTSSLQLSEAKKLLAKVENQGLFHTCGAEGYIEKYGCDECKEGLEGQILKFLGPTIEKLSTEKRVAPVPKELPSLLESCPCGVPHVKTGRPANSTGHSANCGCSLCF